MKPVAFACILATTIAQLLLIAQKTKPQSKLPLELILSPERTSVPSGADFTLQVHVVNHSNESYDLTVISRTNLNLRFDYDVRTSDGKAVARIPDVGPLMVGPSGGIGPPWSGAQPVDLGIRDLIRSYDMKKPGIYTVRVLYRAPPAHYIGISNTVTVTVLPEKQNAYPGAATQEPDSGVPIAPGSPAEPSTNPETIKLSILTPLVTFGSPIGIKIELINQTDHDLNCVSEWTYSRSLTYLMEIIDASGKLIHVTEDPPVIGSGRPCTLPVGKSKEWEMSVEPQDYPGLAPGKYTLRVSAPDPEARNVKRLYSNAVPFTIE